MHRLTTESPISPLRARLRAIVVGAGVFALGLVSGGCDDELSPRDAIVDGVDALDDDDDADADAARPVEADLFRGALAIDGADQAAADADEPSCDADAADEGSCTDPNAERLTITSCYCGLYNGSPLYVGVHCGGFASTATCCAVKCGELMGALESQK